MAGVIEGKRCETCYGEGLIATDDGPLDCPDCGGAGTLPRQDTLIEWRLREIERLRGLHEEDESARDVRWLAFELRRARSALSELQSLAGELEATTVSLRMRFVANRALQIYDLVTEQEGSDSSE